MQKFYRYGSAWGKAIASKINKCAPFPFAKSIIMLCILAFCFISYIPNAGKEMSFKYRSYT